MDAMDTAVTQGTVATLQTTKEERTWAIFCHLSSLAGFVIPFGNIIGPLIVWLIEKNELPLVDDQGREALNFQISMTLYVIVSIIPVFVMGGFILLFALGLFALIMTVVAARNANDGFKYRYPLCIRFV